MSETARFVRYTDYPSFPPVEMVARSREFRDFMARRRSVRRFSDRAVDPEVIANCLATAASAPSGANMQPWHFVVITSQQLKRRIREAAEREERAFYSERAPQQWLDALAPLGTDAVKEYLETAPCLIAIFQQRHRVGADGRKIKHYYAPESVGIATGILMSALHNAGLVMLPHTPSPMGFLREILERPKSERPFMLLVAGYPAEEVEVPDISRKRLEEVVSFV